MCILQSELWGVARWEVAADPVTNKKADCQGGVFRIFASRNAKTPPRCASSNDPVHGVRRPV